MQILRIANTIYMTDYLKKYLLPILIISVLSFFIFLGANYIGSNLASLSSIITAWVTINPLEVKVSAPAEVEIDKVFKVTAKITNKGEEKIEDVEGKIFLPEELALLKKDTVQEIGVIPGKKEKKIHWSVKGEEIGIFGISVKVFGELQGKEISKESDTIMVEIIEKAAPGKKTRLNLFQRFFNLFQEWFR